MKAETDPITEDEWLLRRVHFDQFEVNGNGILKNAFRPRISGRDPDTNGISLFREACLSHPGEILSHLPEERRGLSGIVRIPFSLINGMGLTFRSDRRDRRARHHRGNE